MISGLVLRLLPEGHMKMVDIDYYFTPATSVSGPERDNEFYMTMSHLNRVKYSSHIPVANPGSVYNMKLAIRGRWETMSYPEATATLLRNGKEENDTGRIKMFGLFFESGKVITRKKDIFPDVYYEEGDTLGMKFSLDFNYWSLYPSILVRYRTLY